MLQGETIAHIRCHEDMKILQNIGCPIVCTFWNGAWIIDVIKK